MALVTSKEMLWKARKEGYAVGAFNGENLEMIKSIIEAAEELKSPVIVQTTPSTIRYGNSADYAGIVKAEAERVSIPVCLHLDHGSSFELAAECMENGYTSVMIDGSRESFEDNILLTAKVAEYARKKGIPTEAELGKVGGKEDDLDTAGDTSTDVEEAVEFVRRTGIDSLAVAIGTAHGFYTGTPVLNKERLSELADKISIPLVLHGASGLSDEEVRECIKRGISKVNFATELRTAYTDACKNIYREKPDIFDPKEYGRAAMDGVKEQVRNRIRVCGCAGTA